MPRELRYTAIILKKQPFGEADELITFFSKEAGKVRGLAKSVKSPKSKLQQKLQALFLADLRLTSGKLPKIIGAETLKVYAGLRENLEAMKIAFYAVELVLKFTADEQKNEPLFNLLDNFFGFLDSGHVKEVLDLGLAKFKIEVLDAGGLGIGGNPDLSDSKGIFFSSERGGFVGQNSAGALPVARQTAENFLNLTQTTFDGLGKLANTSHINELQNLLSRFIEYQLERKIKSEKYL